MPLAVDKTTNIVAYYIIYIFLFKKNNKYHKKRKNAVGGNGV
jgi:hypothetical protein